MKFINGIKDHWPDLAVAALAIGAIYQASVFCSKDYGSFCSGFLGNLLSDVIIATIFGFLFIKYYDSRNHPHPVLTANYEEQLTFSKNDAKTAGFVLKFGVLNKNRKALQQNDGTYHIFVHKKLSPEIRTGTTGKEAIEKRIQDLDDYVEFHDVNPGPCLHDSVLCMLEVACKLHTDVDESTIYYFFNTESGVFPRNAKFDKDALNNINTWGKLKIKFV